MQLIQASNIMLINTGQMPPSQIAAIMNYNTTPNSVLYKVTTAFSVYSSPTFSNGTINFVNTTLAYANSGNTINSFVSGVYAGIRTPLVINNNAVLNNLYIMTTDNLSNGTTKATISASPLHAEQFSRPAYSYIQINSTISDSNISSAEYTFSVNRSWVESQNITPSQVTMYKYTGGSWVPLSTYLVNANATKYTYNATSNSLSTYAVSYTSGSVAGNANPESVAIGGNYKLYLCDAGANYTFSTSGAAFTWTQTVGAPPGAPVNNGANASVGYQTTSTCSAYTTGASFAGLALAGIGLNLTLANQKTYANSAGSAASLSLSFTSDAAGSFAAILISGGYYDLTGVTLPTGCAQNQFISNADTYETAYIAICKSIAAGSLTVTASDSASGSIAMAAYVWPPFKVTLDDKPTSATITTNGATQLNGNSIDVVGNSLVVANKPTGNYIFSSWSVSNSLNLTLSNSIAASTQLWVMGNGIITANWNGIANFIETGLPASTTWNVVFNGILMSSSSTVVGPFFTPGNVASFSVNSQVVSGTTYIPSISLGNSLTANVVYITFAAAGCGIQLSNSLISFGSLNPLAATSTSNLVVDTNQGGSVQANILVAGGNWISGANNFYVANTLWNPSSSASYIGNAVQLIPSLADTKIKINAGGNGDIYFGAGVPAGQPSGSYSQNIILENLC